MAWNPAFVYKVPQPDKIKIQTRLIAVLLGIINEMPCDIVKASLAYESIQEEYLFKFRNKGILRLVTCDHPCFDGYWQSQEQN